MLSRQDKRKKRHLRVRKQISGNLQRPRLVVCRSSKHIYGSLVIDDVQPNKVLLTVSSLGSDFKKVAKPEEKGGNVKGAFLVGKLLAERAKSMNIETVVFDRAGYGYKGRVKSFAEGARQGGLKF
ncbi:MAG TPA: 50S ribosomal protein L18 [bacterium]|nr:50S ribosomal protein L18 [bacterium]HOL49390.1 50S ribosomal protein L18 [bacterium]HPO51411.1 50S ribosomal protein L18 [bacterium]HXK44747.1 50S ribosomal protein L18 [bacterium]